MMRLLRQNWFVARRSTLLWLLCAVMFAASFWAKSCLDAALITPGLGFVYAFMAAVYLGDAGTSGRLNGQIIHGSTRTGIVTAGFLTLLVLALLILLATLAGGLAAAFLMENLDAYNPAGALLSAAGLIINAGLAKVIARTGPDTYTVTDVQDWITGDDTLPGKAE